MKIKLIAILLTLVTRLSGIDQDGFKSGMTYGEVRELLATRNGKVSLNSRLITFKEPNGVIIAFSFVGKDGTLGIFQKTFDADFSRFVALLDRFREQYGRVVDAYGLRADPAATFSEDTLSFVWNTLEDQIQVEYKPGQVSIRYHDKRLAERFIIK